MPKDTYFLPKHVHTKVTLSKHTYILSDAW